MRYLIIFLLISGALITNCLADTVTLKNKHAIDGVITEESESKVVLDVGCGSITLDRADIESIERSNEAANKLMMDNWKKEYFDTLPAPTPEDEGILNGFKQIRYEKGQLAKKIAVRDDIAKEIYMLQEGVSGLQDDRDDIGRRIKATNPKKDPIKYNELIVEFNSVGSRLNKIVGTISDLQKEQEEINTQIIGYINTFTDFKMLFGKEYQKIAKLDVSRQRKDFYENMREKLQALEADLKRQEVKFTRRGQSIIVAAVLNNKQHVRLLVDTGASLTTISRSAVSRLGVDPEKLKQDIKLVLADGSTASAKFILLDSVKVGEAEAKNVSAAVIPDDPSMGVDGLLGMSFLNKFSFSIDTEKQKLIFSSFK